MTVPALNLSNGIAPSLSTSSRFGLSGASPPDWRNDQTSNFAFLQLEQKATMRISADFPGCVRAALPYKVEKVLTDNEGRHRSSHDLAEASLDQRPGEAHKPNRQGHDGQALPQRRSRATLNHLTGLTSAYYFVRRPKAMKELTPYRFICKRWVIEPEHFSLNPLHQMPRLNI